MPLMLTISLRLSLVLYLIFHFLRGLDAGVIDQVQRPFSYLEGKGASAPGIHRDASCVIMAAIFVFCLYSVLQLADSITIYFYLACALIAAVVEGKWMMAHANLSKSASRPDVIKLYRETAGFSRARMMPLRLLSIAYLLSAPFAFTFEGRLDLISWLLVFLYGFKLYLMCCLPGMRDDNRKEIHLSTGDVVL
jgi:hypothetical protein